MLTCHSVVSSPSAVNVAILVKAVQYIISGPDVLLIYYTWKVVSRSVSVGALQYSGGRVDNENLFFFFFVLFIYLVFLKNIFASGSYISLHTYETVQALY